MIKYTPVISDSAELLGEYGYEAGCRFPSPMLESAIGRACPLHP
jgi:hypothetical protein